MAPSSGDNLGNIVDQRRILVCVGSGGVGKTSTAAALALEGACRGKKTLAMTIDPAKRLANSLGLPRLDHEERRVADELLPEDARASGGALYAMMLDQKRAFDEVVERHAPDPALRAKILGNRIYQQISSSLTGSQEYAAMAKLYQVEREGNYDLIVVDTPPTTHALDFLDAPQKVASAIDSPAVEWFVKPMKSTGQFSLKLIGRGGSFVLRRVAKFVGSDFLQEMAHFFVDAGAVLTQFRQRALDVFELLRQPKVGFVLVASPEAMAIDEALFFHQRLVTSRMPFAGFVVNRVHAEAPAAPSSEELLDELARLPALRSLPPAELRLAADALLASHADIGALAHADRAQIARLGQVLAEGQTLVTVPFLDRDVHDVPGLSLIGSYLVGRTA